MILTSTPVDRLGFFLGEVNALHPFREGNGRAQREFFLQVALHAGWRLDFASMDAVENVEASIEATLDSHVRLASMLDPLISPL
ncbi:MAG: Fic family protein [Nitriliruptor sp.]|uniref:Fic family protein n=1 Tax=Nitriliruptor sp. TaxID=2448056 RepID=UPI0034A09C4B